PALRETSCLRRHSRCEICHTTNRSVARALPKPVRFFCVPIRRRLVYASRALNGAGSGVSNGTFASTQPQQSLKGIGVSAWFSVAVLDRILRRCAWKRYAPGEPILDYLDKSDDVFFIVLGEVRVTIYSSVGKAVSFRELPAGEMFGEFPAIDGGS